MPDLSKLKHIWSVVCNSSSIDQETNNFSLYNVIEQLEIKVKPGGIPKNEDSAVVGITLELITLWKKEAAGESLDVEQRTEWVDPAGKVLLSSVGGFKIGKVIDRARFRFQANGLKVTVPGYYYFRVAARYATDTDFIIVAETPVQVNILEG